MNKFYLKEFQFFDGEHTVVFNIVALDDDKITVAVTHSGKISVCDYELHTDKNGLYFEYGVAGREHIHIVDFLYPHERASGYPVRHRGIFAAEP